MLEALKLACNFAYQQPDHPLGFVGWSHIANQVMTIKPCNSPTDYSSLPSFCRRVIDAWLPVPRSQHEIGRLGGVRYIINAMKTHIVYWDVQEAGMRALANLAYNHTENAEVTKYVHPLSIHMPFLPPHTGEHFISIWFVRAITWFLAQRCLLSTPIPKLFH